MLRYALRRILWAIPALIGISLVVFLISTLIPDVGPGTLAARMALLASDPAAYDAFTENRRARSADLPRFFDVTPDDVRSRADAAVKHVIAKDAEAPLAAYELGKLGGAAFPYILPKLDNLRPDERGLVAVALAPAAERMGLGEAEVLRDPARAATFWTRFWEERSLDFREPAARRVVDRYLREPTPAREHDLVELDTFVVPLLVAALRTATTTAEQRLVVNQLARAAGRPKARFPDEETARTTARDIANEWESFWFESHTYFEPLEGASRVAATITETRYGRWLGKTLTGRLGFSVRDGKPILEKLITRSPITVGLAAMALALALALAVPVALVSATQRGRAIDHGLAIGLFVLYSAPTFWLAQLLSNFAPKTSGELVLPVLALAAPVTALTARYQRAALLEVLSLEYVRAARARGAGGLRLLFLHVLPNAIAPTLSLAGVLLPQLFGAAFVVEEVFGLEGLGFESVRAVEASDHAWLVAVTMLSAVICSVGLIASDLAAGIIDPRVRELLRRRGRAA